MLIYGSMFLTVYGAVLSFILGAIMGSFLNCTASRLVHGESIVKGRSHCTDCGHVLGPADLVPIFSYIFLKGKCRYCGKKMSPRYLISEIVSALVFVGIFLRYGAMEGALTLRLAEMLFLFSMLLCISFCDMEDFTIPDRLILITIAGRVVFLGIRFFTDRAECISLLLPSLIGGFSVSLPLLAVVLIYEKIKNTEAMGGGDFKLLFAIGVYFPWNINLFGFIAACVLGIVFAVLASKKKGEAFPFGPAISAGAWIAALCGAELVDAYMRLF